MTTNKIQLLAELLADQPSRGYLDVWDGAAAPAGWVCAQCGAPTGMTSCPDHGRHHARFARVRAAAEQLLDVIADLVDSAAASVGIGRPCTAEQVHQLVNRMALAAENLAMALTAESRPDDPGGTAAG